MSSDELAADDALAVMDLVARYTRCIDTGDIEGWISTFHPDAILRSVSGDVVGHDQLREWVTGLLRKGVVGGGPAQLRQFVGLPRIEGSASECHVQTYCVVLDHTADRIKVSLLGRYEDVCVKAGADWYFMERTIHHDLNT